MDIQTRVSIETVEMLEYLRDWLSNLEGIKVTNGQILTRAINDTYDQWNKISWSTVSNLPVKLPKRGDNFTVSSSPRPLFQVNQNIHNRYYDEFLPLLKEKLQVAHYVKSSAAIRLLLRYEIYLLQANDNEQVSLVKDNIKRSSEEFISSHDVDAELINQFSDFLIKNLVESGFIK